MTKNETVSDVSYVVVIVLGWTFLIGPFVGLFSAPIHYFLPPLNLIGGGAVALLLAPLLAAVLARGRRPLSRLIIGSVAMIPAVWIARSQSYLWQVLASAVSGYLSMCVVCWWLGRHVWKEPESGVQCLNCGYSLAGLRDDVCPECGTRS